MYFALGLMFVGIFVGRLLLKVAKISVSVLLMAAICLLLFILGLELGYNDNLISKFASIGMVSLIIAVSVVLGSCLAAKVLYSYVLKNQSEKNAEFDDVDKVADCKNDAGVQYENSDLNNIGGAWSGTIMIIGAFAVGLVLAMFDLMPYGHEIAGCSKSVLYLLMFLVGMNLGLDPTIVSTIKSQPKRVLFLPFFTMLGTFAGAVAAYAFLALCDGGISLLDALSVGSGFGYYSLSSIFLNEARGAELGTIALAANIIRELITIIFAPLMVKFFGKLAPISSGGATSMDTTLPAIQKSCGNRFVPLSIYHGIVVDFSVPFFLTLFLSLQ